MIERDVGELRAAGDIADGKDAAVGCAQPRVNGDALRRGSNAGGCEIKRLDIRAPPGGEQQVRAGNPLAIGEMHANYRAVAPDPDDLDTRTTDNTFTRQPLGEDAAELGIITGKQRADIEHRDLRAQPTMGLRHLDADRSAADHDQVLG